VSGRLRGGEVFEPAVNLSAMMNAGYFLAM